MKTGRHRLYFYQGGYHGSCIFVRQGLVNLMKLKQYASPRGDRKRELGFQTASFCPIPVGDSPSSKRMYDVLQVSNCLFTTALAIFKTLSISSMAAFQ